MKKLITFLFMGLLLLGYGHGRECQSIEDVSSGCDILVFAVNNSNHAQVFTDATCTINITRPDSTNFAQTMSANDLGSGFYNYTFQETQLGVYPVQSSCVKSGFSSRNSGIITVDVSDQERMEEINDTVTLIDTNLDTTYTGVIDVNNSNNQLLLDVANVSNEVDAIQNRSHSEGNWSNTEGSSLTVQAITESVAINLSGDHDSGNWSAIADTSGISVSVNVSEIWDFNITSYRNFNSSSVPYKAGELLYLIYNWVVY